MKPCRTVSTTLVLLVGMSLTSGGLLLHAQDAEGDTPTVFRVDTRLVEVDVVVRTDDGPVEDLTIEDFTLYDEGREQSLAFFEIRRADTPVTLPDTTITPVLPAGTVSNRPLSPGPTPAGATILLLDRLNTEALDQPRANAQAIEFLESLDGQHQVAIYELRGQLRLIEEFTSDREVLLRAARSMDTEFSSQLDASYGANATGGFEAISSEVGIDPDLVDARTGGGIEERGTADLDQQVAAYYVNNRIRVTADVLQVIADHMSRLPGRKSLVWLSGRFPFSFSPASDFLPNEVSTDTRRQLERTARAITDANLAIYPISAVGLLAPTFNDPSLDPGASAAARGRFRFSRTIAGGGDRLELEPNSTNTMLDIAEMTGGEAFYLTNGIAEAIEDAVSDSQVIYTLGFYPGTSGLDREFHDLRVEVSRPNVEVRYRQGYYGFGAPDPNETVNPVPMNALVTSPVNATALGLTALPIQIEGEEEGGTIELRVDVEDLNLVIRDDVWYGMVEVATLLVTGVETRPNPQTGNLLIALTSEQLETAIDSGGYPLFRAGRGDADIAWLRVVVRDLVGGSAGSIWINLD